MAIITGTPSDDTLGGTSDADQIFGLGGNDQLLGHNGDDLIEGGDGHDALRGLLGNDILLGGTGDDFLNGGQGDDIIDGGTGWDRAAFSTGAVAAVTVDLNIQGVVQNTGQGNDTLIGIEHVSGTRFNDVLTGNGGDNWIWGGSDGSGVTGDDTIFAGDGNDLVEVGAGNHYLDGGAGTDTLSLWGNADDIGPSGVTVSLLLQGAVQDTEQGIMFLTGFENLSGSVHGDSLTGDGGSNRLAGDVGDDQLSGGAGDDTLYGDGRIIIDTHGTAGSGPITTYADIAAAFPDLVAGNDTLEGGLGDDLLNGGGGSDTASYANATGAVQVFLNNFGGGSSSGADGNDTFVSIENVTGSDHDDFLTGNNLDNVLNGGGGHDQLRGNGGNDTLLGGDGDDFLAGGDGDDILDGGDGWDRTSFFTGATAGVTVDLNIQGAAQNTGRGMDILIGIEHTSGTAFDDVLIGNAGDNWLWGDPTGNDTISGNDGNDLIWVGVGHHVVSGGSGIDTLGSNATDLPSGVTWSLALQGSPQATTHGTIDMSGFENLSGTEHDDSLTGDGGANLLAGGLGNDTLSGGAGNDILYGDGLVTVDTHGGGSGPIVTYADATTVLGGVAGNDVLDGGKGDDVLNGGSGDDVLTGGNGTDRFVFGPQSGNDRITDFKKDVIAFEGVAGVDDFGDLIITRVGRDTLISWGDGSDSILIEGMRPNQLDPAFFTFG